MNLADGHDISKSEEDFTVTLTYQGRLSFTMDGRGENEVVYGLTIGGGDFFVVAPKEAPRKDVLEGVEAFAEKLQGEGGDPASCVLSYVNGKLAPLYAMVRVAGCSPLSLLERVDTIGDDDKFWSYGAKDTRRLVLRWLKGGADLESLPEVLGGVPFIPQGG